MKAKIKNKIQDLREWLAHQCCILAIHFDMSTYMRRAHASVCYAAFKAAQDAGADGDLTVRIIVEGDNPNDNSTEVWEINEPIPQTTIH